MSSPDQPPPRASVPIPAAPPVKRKRSKVMQSSLELVFSYSRSQQMRYGKQMNSAPSFVSSFSGSEGPSSGRRRSSRYGDPEDGGEFGSSDDDLEEEDEGEDGEDEQMGDSGELRRTDEPEEMRGSSGMVTPFAPDSIEPESDYGNGLEASVATLMPNRTAPGPSSVPSESEFRHLFNVHAPNAVLGTSAGTSSSSHRSASRGPGGFAQPNTALSRENSLSRGRSLGQPPTQAVRRPSRNLSPTALDRDIEPHERTPLVVSKPAQAYDLGILSPQGDSAGRAERRRSRVRNASLSPTATPRRRSSARVRRGTILEQGESTDGQTLFNAVAVLVGIGLLSLPLAFSYAGWIGGSLMLLGFAWITCYTAKLLARLIRADPSMRGYTDIGRKAFGSWANGGICFLFCLELFALGVALIVLFGDSLNVIIPRYSSNTYKLFGFFVILPTALLPLRLLSLPSLLSGVSSLLLILVILIDGFVKTTPPGSLLHPAKTSVWPEMKDQNWLGGIGLILAGFGGHAVMPSLARDMKKPQNFDSVINKAFVIATIISFVAGSSGYLMIGDKVSDEITRDIMKPEYGYPRWLNLVALWMIVINPLTKFGLCSRPLNVTIEGVLGLSAVKLKLKPNESSITDTSGFPSAISQASAHRASTPRASQSGLTANTAGQRSSLTPSTPDPKPSEEHSAEEADMLAQHQRKERAKLFGRVISRTIVTALCTATAIGLPGFGRVMAFLGSFSAFLICIILPLVFYVRLAPRLRIDEGSQDRRTTRVLHVVMVTMSVVFMVAGTAWAMIPGTGREQ